MLRHSLLNIRRWFLFRKEFNRLQRSDSSKAPILAEILSQWNAHKTIDEPLIHRIEKQRAIWLGLHEPPGNVEPGFDSMPVFIRACHASKGPVWAELLYRVVRKARPRVILELGTNLGISSAYLAAAGRSHDARVITLEGSSPQMALARSFHEELGLTNVIYEPGRFQKVLPRVLQNTPEIDFAFIDGHHQLEPTLKYFDLIYPRLSDEAIVVFDDINWSDGMIEAWHRLQSDARFALMIDIVNLGITVTKAHADNQPPALFKLARPDSSVPG